MKTLCPMALLVLAACAGAPGGDSAPPRGVTTFDGAYPGTIETVFGCDGPRSDPTTMTIANGAAVLPVSGGHRVTARVAADGRFEQLGSPNPIFLVEGRGQISDGNAELTVAARSMYATRERGCEFRYRGRRAS